MSSYSKCLRNPPLTFKCRQKPADFKMQFTQPLHYRLNFEQPAQLLLSPGHIFIQLKNYLVKLTPLSFLLVFFLCVTSRGFALLANRESTEEPITATTRKAQSFFLTFILLPKSYFYSLRSLMQSQHFSEVMNNLFSTCNRKTDETETDQYSVHRKAQNLILNVEFEYSQGLIRSVENKKNRPFY